ncbi:MULTISPECIES: sulfate ABC transporter substrate-binding protein [unclassified Microcoleus]|uniref:sulfate ABC transporter substrate-binding protein n=1 Tax=unclassified Microcoleus TaxID=2642155 RepID=UPI002FD34C05
MSPWQRLTQHLQWPQQPPVSTNQSFTALKRFVSLFLVGISLSLAVASCGQGTSNNPAATPGSASPAANKGNVELTLVSFSVTKAAHEAIIPKFVEYWQKEKGQTVTLNQSYGGSGSQTRAVIDGLEADVVHLAIGSDTQRIEKAGLIEPGWEKEFPNEGIVSKSVGAIVTREGNPKNIKTWEDLSKDGVKLITADPKTSGVARWNFLALWGSVVKTGGDETKALDFTTKVYKNVPILTKDAREATDVFFKQGQGDALINYENEIVLAGQKGEKPTYSIPEVNISIDNPIAIIDKNVDKHGTREVAEAFVKFLYSPEAQREFAKAGFRPVDATVAAEPEFAQKYAPIKNLFTAQDLGGWGEIEKQFFASGAVFDKIQGSTKQ